MSWSSSAYPPPRRSRSRSPYRDSYPPRPPYSDQYPPADTYRGEYDGYNRDRAWGGYERDRPGYDYSRRGRSRSPPPDEASRKRRRSVSPYERDRYEPRPRYADDYDTHTRGYGYSSPRRSAYPPPSRRAPPDPHTFDYPASLKQYAEWFRYFYPQQAIDEDNADKAAEQEAGDGSKPRNGIRARWEKYKKEFAANQLQTMFDHHRKSPWFAEKYDPSPEFANLRKRVRKEGWRNRINTFLDDLEAGRFDPDLSDTLPEPTPPVKESTKKEESEVKAEPEVKKEEKMEEAKDEGETNDGLGPNDETLKAEEDVNLDADDDGGDHEGGKAETNGKAPADAKRNNRGEEVAVMPEGNQVMIRTIPPDIGRLKLETVGSLYNIPGFVYLALGDPLQKRNFYRAGWMKFREDADMSAVMAELNEKKIEGFKLHVLHNTQPFKNRIRYAPEVASRPERLQKDLANAKQLAAILENEYMELRKFKMPSKKEGDAQANGDAHGVPEQDVPMVGPEAVADEVEEPEPRERGSDAVERRIEQVMADLRDSGAVDPSDEVEFNLKKTVVSLDLYLAYLRAAFHTCYYCAVVTDHLEELQRKCIKHVRKPLTKAMLDEIKAAEADKLEKVKEMKEEPGESVDKEKGDDKEREKDRAGKDKDVRDWKRNDERWLDWLDSKIALLINRDGVDPRVYGGKSYDEELTKAVEPHMKQEDEGKFRCKTCQKLFKATSFVEKHIANKHSELVKHLDEIPYFNNFALDPHHIQPFSHPPPATGSSQAPPPQAYGLPGPVNFPPPHADYGRGGPAFYPAPFPQGYPPPPAPPYANGAPYWDPYAAYPYPPPPPGAFPPPPRRDDGITARRLSDRISGYAPGHDHTTEIPITVPASAGLPAKPPVVLEPGTGTSEETRGRGRGGRRGGGVGRAADAGPLPPPPPDAKEDPRAAAGKKVSYHDMDLVAEGEVELQY